MKEQPFWLLCITSTIIALRRRLGYRHMYVWRTMGERQAVSKD